MAVIASTGKDRSWVAALRRVTDSCWLGQSNNAEQAPVALNNEAILAVNAAGTGTNSLIKADAADNVVVTDNGGSQRFLPNSVEKTIADGAATALFDVSCPQNSRCAGAIFYHVFASDGTDFQAMSGLVTYAAVNKAGTLTLTITNATANDAKAVSSGTLTLAWTFVTGTAKGTVKLQPTGSLTETTFNVKYSVFPIKGDITVL